MTVITTRLLVSADGTIAADPALPAGSHVVVVQIDPARQLSTGELPTHDTPHWDDSVSLRREDMYADDGR